MNALPFSIRKRTLVAGLALVSLSAIGLAAFAQEPPEETDAPAIVNEIEVLTTQDEKEASKDKREQDELRKQRDTLVKQRQALDRQLADISRKLGEPNVRINGNFNGAARAFNFDSKPFLELRGRALEETKAATEARRKAIEELRKSMRGQEKEVAEEMKRAIEEMERAEKSRGDERRTFRFFNDADGKLKALPAMPDLPEVPKMNFRFDDKTLTLPRNFEGNKDFEASMRRFEQKMQAWQKQFEARMKDWQKQMEEKNEKKP